jgi:hypothetical protein
VILRLGDVDEQAVEVGKRREGHERKAGEGSRIEYPNPPPRAAQDVQAPRARR